MKRMRDYCQSIRIATAEKPGIKSIFKSLGTGKAVIAAVQGMILFFLAAYLFYDRIWLGFTYPVFFYPYMLYRLREQEKIQKRQSRLEFKEMLLSIYNSLSAGYSLENSMRAARDDLRAVNGGKRSTLEQQLSILCSGLEMNQPVEVLMERMASELRVDEAEQFAQILWMIKRNGGNLIQIIKKSVEHMNQKIQVKEEILTMVSAKKIEQKIMSVMPFFILLYVRLMNPGYFQVLYESLGGTLLTTVCLAVLAGSVFWARRIVEIEV